MADPMTTADAAYEESVTKADEARVEQHWREAEDKARDIALTQRALGYGDVPATLIADIVLVGFGDTRTYDEQFKALYAFAADYGTPALLRVIAKALEASK